MLLRRFYHTKLAQASYLIGCPATGEAIVIDANRSVEQYQEAAEAESLRITHVTETHIHADFISGSRELAERVGARLLLSDEGGPAWRYRYAEEAGATLLTDGDHFAVGAVRFDVVHTPGHTPEHLAFLVTDTAVSDRPMGALTGDFIFVGDVGRPDLLETAVGIAGTAGREARRLFRSLQRLKTLPDYLQLWPGHGAGSACGKALGAMPQTTLGYERLVNWALTTTDEESFVRQALADQPEPPRYFSEMKRINRDGPRLLERAAPPSRLAAGRVAGLLDRGALVLDLRPAAAFAAGHLPGTINIPYDRSFTTWAGWLVPYTDDLYLLAGDADTRRLGAIMADLAMIGLDRVAGYFGADVLEVWTEEGRPLATIPQLSATDVAALGAGAQIVDVRWPREWATGHLPGAANLPLPDLLERIGELPTDRTLVMQCQGGGRASIAAGLLSSRGHRVANLAGGYAAWTAAGLPVERDPG